MSNYANLKSAIQEVIKTNGRNEITGQLLQTELLAMINTLGYGYQFMGVASTDTVPGTPDAKVFYIAYSPGTYTNFGGIVVSGLCVLKYDSSWTKEDIPVSGGGTSFSTNEEDLLLSNSVLQFANRIHPANTSGKSHIIVRRGVSLTTQISVQNAIYEIRDEFSLGGNTLTLPVGCVLKFNGGCFKNGTIVVTSQVSISSNDTIVDKDLFVDSTNNEIYLNLMHDCNLTLSNSDTHGRIFVKSNYSAEIQYHGSTALIPTFEDCIIKKTASSGFRNASGDNQVAIFRHCRVYSDEFQEQSEGLCTTAFSVAGTSSQDSYDKVASGMYRVFVENCEFEGQGLWGNIRAVNSKFIVTRNNLFNYEQLHLVGDSVIDGCFFTSSFTTQTVDNSLQDVIDCYTSKHITITNCIFDNLFCAAIISYKQNPLGEYYIKGCGIDIANNVFQNCYGVAFMFYSDDGNYTPGAYTLNNNNQVRIRDNYFFNVKSVYSQSSIATSYADVINIGSCCANVIIDGNRFEFTKRSCAIKIGNYCENIIISNNLFYREEGSSIGTSFMVTFEISSGVYSYVKDIIIEGNNAANGGAVLTQSTATLVNLRGCRIINNDFSSMFNQAQGTDLETSFNIVANGNSHLFNTAKRFDSVKDPSDNKFMAEKLKYRGSSFFDLDGNKIVTWNGYNWIDQAGNTVTY